MTKNQSNFSLFIRNLSNKANVSEIVKTLERIYEFRLSQRSKYQTINFELRFQHKQRDYQLIIKATINRDFIHLRNRVHRSNSNRQENYMITKFIDSIHLRCRLFSNRNNLREQSRSHCLDQEFSVSRSNQAHQHSNSFHQKESNRRINRFNLHTHETNDSR